VSSAGKVAGYIEEVGEETGYGGKEWPIGQERGRGDRTLDRPMETVGPKKGQLLQDSRNEVYI
jgi:hypothetical protein